ncbi:MAG: hypothetical protein ORN29_08335 [Rhodoferax sp.]|nr:hypothetical protein [Rhodoferax sp.]
MRTTRFILTIAQLHASEVAEANFNVVAATSKANTKTQNCCFKEALIFDSKPKIFVFLIPTSGNQGITLT